MRIKLLSLFCGAALGLSFSAAADVNGDMNNFFNKLGFASNTSQPQVWQGQAAGYASGGSLYARTQVKTIQLVSMTLPDINAGCGGIDAYLGSFSFINSEQLQRFGKQIMSNAAGYFFDLALQTTVPEIKTAKDFLQKMATDMNSMNLSSCQAAQGIVGGLFPRTQVAQQKVCQDIAGESNIFSDWAASRQGCTVGGKMDSVQDKASDKDKERVMKNINIMWNALSKNRLFDGNKELKEFVMTLTGTLIFGENSEITPLPARTTDQDLIKAMMEGGTAKIYHCNDSDKCLKVVADATVTITANKALKNQIRALLSSIQNKAVADEKLTEQEKGFISSTTIPVFKYLVDPQMLGVSNSLIYQLPISPSASMPISRFGWASALSLIEQRNARFTGLMVLNSVVSESIICAGGSATSERISDSPPSSTSWVLSGFPSSPISRLISRGINSLPVGSFALRNSVSPSVISNNVRTGMTTNACSSSTACCRASREVKNGITVVPSSFSQC